jgi:hypothetical protein
MASDDKPKPAPATPPSKDDAIDRASEDSFPASDPPSNTGITGPGGDRKPGADPARKA